jgi:hypothetical protein
MRSVGLIRLLELSELLAVCGYLDCWIIRLFWSLGSFGLFLLFEFIQIVTFVQIIGVIRNIAIIGVSIIRIIGVIGGSLEVPLTGQE